MQTPAVPPHHRTLDARLAYHATHRPEHPALRCAGVEVTYGRLYAESARGALALAAAGLTKGSRVGYLGKESVRFYELLFACAASGAVLVPVNWRLAPADVAYILRDSHAELLFTDAEFLPTAREIRPDLPDLRQLVLLDGTGKAARTFRDWKDAGRGAPAPALSDTGDAVAQMYTSGTTGLPTCAVLAHRSFFAARGGPDNAGPDEIGFRPDDISLIGISGSHIGGLWYATQGFNAGVTNIALRSFGSREALETIRGSGVTTAFLVPAMLLMLLDEPGAAEADFVTLRKVVHGGSPVAGPLRRRCIAVMRCDLAQLRGLPGSGDTAGGLPPAGHFSGSPHLRATGRA
ncbi:AMP-binding protein [Streptomyces sp. NPDC014733]|uniref:AMP-binding protein n=1 Tax=Streptomyces sp. NPDC014733 TaxID=3364885 RepID=UPI0036FEE001